MFLACVQLNAATAAAQVCGDGLLEGLEACDDGNTSSGDGCDASCMAVENGWAWSDGRRSPCDEVCGDGLLLGMEVCDDGNTSSGDGCNASCVEIESGWTCPVPGDACISEVCGDGLVEGAEVCDDGNTSSGDGCDASCTAVETGWELPGSGTALALRFVATVCGLEPRFATTGTPAPVTAVMRAARPWRRAGAVRRREVPVRTAVVTGRCSLASYAMTTATRPAVTDATRTACWSKRGWSCAEPGSPCTEVCADGLRVGDEVCDDGNAVAGRRSAARVARW